MKIQSTLIKPSTQGNVTVELIVSASPVPDADQSANTVDTFQQLTGSDSESIRVVVSVPVNHNYFSGIQSDAIRRAIKILESARNQLVDHDGE